MSLTPVQTALITRALQAAGYEHMEPTEENLREAGKDYADSGVWRDIGDPDEIQDATIRDIAHSLIRYCRPHED